MKTRKLRQRFVPAGHEASQRMRSGAIRVARHTSVRLRHFGVSGLRSFMILPILLAVVIASYIAKGGGQVETFWQPDDTFCGVSGTGIAASAYADPATVPEYCRLAWLQCTWRELEPQEGEYAFDRLAEEIRFSAWCGRGTKLILRLSMDSPDSGEYTDLPDWLYDATGDGAEYLWKDETHYCPDYSNLLLQEAHGRLLENINAYFGDSIAYVEVGSLGTDGMWCALSDECTQMPMLDIASVYLWQYSTVFGADRILCPNAYREATLQGTGLYMCCAESEDETWQWLNRLDYGGWDDGTSSYCRPYPQYGLENVTGCHIAAGTNLGGLSSERAASLRDRIRRCRASYLCVNDIPASGQDDAYRFIEELAHELGCRIWLRRGRWDASVSPDCSLQPVVTVCNDGVAAFAGAWDTDLALLRDGKVICREKTDADVRSWLPGETVVHLCMTVPLHIDKGVYTLAVSVRDPHNDGEFLPFAMTADETNGWYALGSVTVQ